MNATEEQNTLVGVSDPAMNSLRNNQWGSPTPNRVELGHYRAPVAQRREPLGDTPIPPTTTSPTLPLRAALFLPSAAKSCQNGDPPLNPSNRAEPPHRPGVESWRGSKSEAFPMEPLGICVPKHGHKHHRSHPDSI